MSRSSLTEQGDITKNCISNDMNHFSHCLVFSTTNMIGSIKRFLLVDELCGRVWVVDILIDSPPLSFECQTSLIKIIQADTTPWVSNHLNVSILHRQSQSTGENSFKIIGTDQQGHMPSNMTDFSQNLNLFCKYEMFFFLKKVNIKIFLPMMNDSLF